MFDFKDNRRSLFVIVASALVIFGVIVALLDRSTDDYDAAYRYALHTREVLGTIESVRADFNRSEAFAAAYLVARRPSDREEARLSWQRARSGAEAIRTLTSDNRAQQSRVPDLLFALDERHRTLDSVFALVGQVPDESLRAVYAEDLSQTDRLRGIVVGLREEENRLLAIRSESAKQSSSRIGTTILSVLVLAAILVVALSVRLLRELARGRQDAEMLRAAANEAQSHGDALGLFNATRDRDELLTGILAILADQLGFPTSAFYASDRWSGELSVAATHATPTSIPRTIARGEGILGQVALSRRTILVDTSDFDLPIDLGFGAVAPKAILACPVGGEDELDGVLLLGSASGVSSSRLAFVDRLSVQLGIALRQIGHLDRQAKLADQLRIRGEEIARSNAELENANRLKSEFLATMSHELRTPLNAIIGFSETMRAGIAGPLAPKQQEFVGIIFDSGQHLLSLIDDVLDLSKIEAGYAEVDATSAQISEFVSNGLSIVRERASSHKIHLDSSLHVANDAIVVDPRKAKQIVYNLVSNAVKFTPDGGRVSLSAHDATSASIAAERFPLVIGTPQSGANYVEFRVTDTGIGIRDEDLPRLFHEFVQLESALTRRNGGTGLGLALVSKLTALLGGVVGVRSAVGTGSRFSVYLPRRPAAPNTSAAPRPALPVSETSPRPKAKRDAIDTRPRALVVEDDQSARAFMRSQLESIGLVVDTANDAETGLMVARENPPAVLVLDILLPGMDGWAMLEALQNDPLLKLVPVVITSVVADVNKGISLGAHRVLQKPISAEMLRAAIDAIGLRDESKSVVLVADDDPNAVDLVSMHLSKTFGTVLKTYGGAEAIAVASERLPDVIVLDLVMPDVTGFDVVEFLKGDPVTASIPICILTSKSLTTRERSFLQGHVELIMQKSEFNHGRFVSEVRRALLESTGSAPGVAP